MRIPTVEKFLCCFRLETGATFLGWIGLIVGSLVFLYGLFLSGFAAVNFPVYINTTYAMSGQQLEDSSSSQILVVAFWFLIASYCALSVYACIQLIRGVKNRSSRQLKLYLILVGLETILAFLTILQFTWLAFTRAVTGTIINGYVFICIHSLWEIFRDEAMRGHNLQYRQTTMIQKV